MVFKKYPQEVGTLCFERGWFRLHMRFWWQRTTGNWTMARCITLPYQPEPFQYQGRAGGGSHSLFLKSDGSVLATGMNYHGQLGDGTNIERYGPVSVHEHRDNSGFLSGVKAIDAGTFYSVSCLRMECF